VYVSPYQISWRSVEPLARYGELFDFWASVCKTVRPMLSDPYLSVCIVGALWPNGWMDEDETWHRGRPRAWPQCFRWGTQLPLTQRCTAPNFRPCLHAVAKLAVWIKVPLGREVGLGLGDIVLDGGPAPPIKGHTPHFSAHVYCGQPAGWINMPLDKKIDLAHPYQQRDTAPNFRPTSIVTERLDGS